jgi:hypothetical protein
MSNANPKTKSKTSGRTPATLQRLRLFGPPPLLEGEDAAAYDALFAGVHAAVKPVDAIDEMLVADVVELEWEVLRWRRLESTLVRVYQREALKEFLDGQLGYDVYAEDFERELANTLKDNLPRDQADTAEQLARAYAQNDPDAEDEVEEIFEKASGFPDINKILDTARARKAEELTEKYVRRDPDAIKLVDEILAGASVDIDDLTAKKIAGRIAYIEQINRLATIAESRRNTSLREIDRRRPLLGESLRRGVKEVEEVEFKVLDTMPAKGENAA